MKKTVGKQKQHHGQNHSGNLQIRIDAKKWLNQIGMNNLNMKVLVLYDYPPSPGGLATQGDLLYKGLLEMGVDAHAVHFESAQEKEWYYRWFEPDVVVGVGYWGHTPQLVLHPQRYGVQPVPWLVADGYIANYQEVLNALPLILVTSNWVKEMYVRDGINGDKIEVLPVGCDTDSFIPYSKDDPKISGCTRSTGYFTRSVNDSYCWRRCCIKRRTGSYAGACYY